MTLFFDNGYVLKPIAEVQNKEDMFRHIHQFCAARLYKIYYSRCWNNKNDDGTYTMTVDVGSHTQFFKIILPDEATANSFMV